MGPVGVVVVDVVDDNSFELTLVQDDGPVEELTAQRADPAFRERVGHLRVPRTRRSRSEGARRRCHRLIHEFRRCSLTRHDVVFGTHRTGPPIYSRVDAERMVAEAKAEGSSR